MVAGRQSFPGVPTLMTLNDLKIQKAGFGNFLAIIGCDAFFNSELH